MHKIKLNGNIYFAEKGVLLSDVLKNNNFSHEHLCGGMGTCKKCTVLVNGKSELSCQYKITSDITVIIPEYEELFSETGVKETRTIINGYI